MEMADLISRAAAIEAAVDGADDWDGGYNPERERYIREHMAMVPAVYAVPVEWLRKWPKDLREGAYVRDILMDWQKEQEAR